MKKLISFIICLFPLLTWGQQSDSLLQKQLTVSELQEDFQFYREMLEETHPALYRYTPKAIMQARLDSMEKLLNQPMFVYDFYQLLAAFNADIRCAHSAIVPARKLRPYMMKSIKTLPFYCYPIDGKQYLLFNGSADERIQPGFELTHINGRSYQEIAERIRRYTWADGYAQAPKEKLLEGTLFGMMYYLLIEQTDQFDCTFKDLEGKSISVQVPAQQFMYTQQHFKKNPVNQEVLRVYKKNPAAWSLTMLKDMPHTAVLRMGKFGHKKAASDDEAQQVIRGFLDDAMKKIHKKNIQHLIVDVRYNSGGWDIMGVELLSYLMKQDTIIDYYEKLHAVMNSSKFLAYSDLANVSPEEIKAELKLQKDGTFRLRPSYNLSLQAYRSKSNRFTGQVYILMDKNTGSSGSEFTAVAKSYNIGTFVGEEVGGAYEGGNGSTFIDMVLPNSKFYVRSPLVYYQNAVTPVSEKGRGTLPDYEVTPLPEDLLIRYDRQMEFVKGLIREKLKK